MRYRVDTPAAPEVLLAIIDRSIDALPDWERDATAAEHRWKTVVDQRR